MPDPTSATTSGEGAPPHVEPPTSSGGALVAALEEAVSALDAVPGSEGAIAAERASLREAIARHLLPRARGTEPPAVVAVTGLGGVGKSRVVNLLAGVAVAAEGPVRSTTTTPTLIMGQVPDPVPDHLADLPSLDPELRIIRRTEPATHGIALLDLPAPRRRPSDRSPDQAPGDRRVIDPVLEKTIDRADLAIVVTTPARYADAGTWSLLEELSVRGVDPLTVLNQAEGPDDEIAGELRRLLQAAGHEPSVVVIERDGDGADLVERVRKLVAEPSAAEIRLASRVGSVARRIAALGDAVDVTGRDHARLVAVVEEQYAAAAEGVRRLIEEGGLAGSVGRPWSDTATELAGVITHRIGDAASRSTSAWLDDPRGAALVAAGGDALWRHPPEASGTALARLHEWPDTVGRLVDDAARRRLRSSVRERLVSMTMTAALGGTVPVRRRWARKLRFGVDAVAARARAALVETAVALVTADRDRFAARIGDRPDPDLAGRLRHVAETMERARPSRRDGQPDAPAESPDA